MLPTTAMIAFFVFLLGFLVFIVVLIIQLIKGKSLNIPAVGMMVCAFLLFGSAVVHTAFEAASAIENADSLRSQRRPTKLEIALGDSPLFYESVENDSTGKWRLLVHSSPENIADHALEYYNTYFFSDKEVHIVVNLDLKTTTILNVESGFLFADVHKYVDGEENDARILGSGDPLNKYMIDLKTGVTSNLSVAPTNNGGTINLNDLASEILNALPEKYQGSKWLNASCDYNDEGIFVYIQVDQGNSNANTTLSLAEDCFIAAKNTVEGNDATLVLFSATIVNNGSPLGVYTTENGKDFSVISDGKLNEVSLP